ncbi:bifunctional riboflavin kinase/FAD synthetase [Rubritalea profundi]|uniref:bifunctional riboflavin kinase/FAD synthetase n=1 Tax=Rubritalea profundi TaxID=1658618 RepID=UPI0013FDF0E8|nr:bifunctional riboflavin kinase/FAD synthetase [Rubritalea profundi]
MFHHIGELRQLEKPVHLALGVFDGVHVGHQEVIRHAVEAAKKDGGLAGVVTFEPHPIRVLAPERAPRRILASIQHKADLLAELGVDFLCVQEFTLDFSRREAREFIEDLAQNSGQLRHIAVGEDWIFGKERGGNVQRLKQWGSELDFEVDAAPPVMVQGERVSSTRIRQAIRDGNISAAKEMLGRDYTVVGTVEKGKQLARQLGFPTANVVAHNEQLPPDGVWELEAVIDGAHFKAIGNLGRRPTVENENARRLLEVHVFDFNGDLYDKVIEAKFLKFIRPEKKFDSVDDLKMQISKDVASVRS